METKKTKSYTTGKDILERLLAVEVHNKEDVLGNKRKMTVAELMHVNMVKKAIDGDIKAYAEILDRVEGKAVQKIEETSELTFVSKPLSELVQFVKPSKTLDETTSEIIDLEEVEPNSFEFDSGEDILEYIGGDIDTDKREV